MLRLQTEPVLTTKLFAGYDKDPVAKEAGLPQPPPVHDPGDATLGDPDTPLISYITTTPVVGVFENDTVIVSVPEEVTVSNQMAE